MKMHDKRVCRQFRPRHTHSAKRTCVVKHNTQCIHPGGVVIITVIHQNPTPPQNAATSHNGMDKACPAEEEHASINDYKPHQHMQRAHKRCVHYGYTAAGHRERASEQQRSRTNADELRACRSIAAHDVSASMRSRCTRSDNGANSFVRQARTTI